MPPLSRRRPPMRAVALVLVAAAMVPALACSGDDGSGASDRADRTTTTTAPTTTTGPGTEATPKPSAQEALETLLTAEQAGDHTTSFRVLSADARESYPDVPRWTRRRSQLPPVTGFTVEPSTDPAVALAVVEHEPGLDPFIGLSAARERQTWRASQQGEGWLLEVEPEVEYLLPPDDAARAPALRWAEAVQDCDQEGAAEVQAIEQIYGTAEGADELCGDDATLEAGEVSELASGPASADLTAQYSTDVFAWARVVEIRGDQQNFGVVLAPIAESWKVVGVQD